MNMSIFPVYLAYWSMAGVEVYSLSKGRALRLGPLGPDTKAKLKGFGPRLLVVARDVLLHARKRYPPASQQDVERAVRMECADIFPLKDPMLFVRATEGTEAYTIADAWAWPSQQGLEIKAQFDYTHAIPEDMAFWSAHPELTAYRSGERVYLVAHAPDGFWAGASYAQSPSPDQVGMFLKGLGRRRVERVQSYGLGSAFSVPGLEVIQRGALEHPLCLAGIEGLSLGQFKVAGDRMGQQKALVTMLRLCIAALLSYALMLYVTDYRLGVAISKLKTETAKIGTVEQEAPGDDQEGQGASELYARQTSQLVPPLRAMQVLANSLPTGDYVKSFTIRGRQMEASIVSAKPIETVEALGAAAEVEDISMQGSPREEGKERFAVNVKVTFAIDQGVKDNEPKGVFK